MLVSPKYTLEYMGLDTKKPVSGVSDKARLKSATETGMAVAQW